MAIFESHAFLTQDVLLGDPTVFKHELTSGCRLDTKLVLLLTQRQSLVGLGNDEGTDTLREEGGEEKKDKLLKYVNNNKYSLFIEHIL